MILNTTPQSGYIVTAVSVPLEIHAISQDQSPVLLLSINSPGQYAFIAPASQIEVSQADALVVPNHSVTIPASSGLPVADANTLGAVKTGNNITVDAEGKLVYEMQPASATQLGGIKAGNGVDVTTDGTISVNWSNLPTNIFLTDRDALVTGKATFTQPVGIANAVNGNDAVTRQQAEQYARIAAGLVAFDSTSGGFQQQAELRKQITDARYKVYGSQINDRVSFAIPDLPPTAIVSSPQRVITSFYTGDAGGSTARNPNIIFIPISPSTNGRWNFRVGVSMNIAPSTTPAESFDDFPYATGPNGINQCFGAFDFMLYNNLGRTPHMRSFFTRINNGPGEWHQYNIVGVPATYDCNIRGVVISSVMGSADAFSDVILVVMMNEKMEYYKIGQCAVQNAWYSPSIYTSVTTSELDGTQGVHVLGAKVNMHSPKIYKNNDLAQWLRDNAIVAYEEVAN